MLALVVAAIVLDAVASVLLALPVLPVATSAKTPIGAIDQAIRDEVGWPQYAAEVDHVVHELPRGARAAIITTNYGEAGALDRYLPAGSPPVYSGHNALADFGRPAPDTTRFVFVGAQFPAAKPLFRHCLVRGHLDNLVGMDNEEQGQPIAMCTGPSVDMRTLMARLRHLG